MLTKHIMFIPKTPVSCLYFLSVWHRYRHEGEFSVVDLLTSAPHIYHSQHANFPSLTSKAPRRRSRLTHRLILSRGRKSETAPQTRPYHSSPSVSPLSSSHMHLFPFSLLPSRHLSLDVIFSCLCPNTSIVVL